MRTQALTQIAVLLFGSAALPAAAHNHFSISCDQSSSASKVDRLVTPARKVDKNVSTVSTAAANAGATCRANGQPQQGEHSCQQIPVVVMFDTSNNCIAYLPYSSLMVKGQGNVKVIWRLWAPQGYKFDVQTGVALKRGKRIDNGQPGPNPPDFWDDLPANEKSDIAFGFKLKTNAAAGEVCHEIKVVGPGGVACSPADPVIANEPN